MATAKKLPSGNYRVRVYNKETKTTKSFTAPTKKEAEYLANEWLTGRKVLPTQDRTLGGCISEYIDIKRDILSPSTVDKYERTMKLQLSDTILRLKLSEIDSTELQREINRLTAKNYAPKTVNNAIGLVSSVLTMYYPERRFTGITRPKVQKRQRQLPTAEEVLDIFGDQGEMKLIVLLGMWQGLRVSEIRGLKKADFYGGKLHVDRVIVTVKNRHIEKDIPKTVESRRGVSVPPMVMDMIDRIDGEYVTRLSGQAIYKRFVRRMEKYGYKGVTFHDLRHINASVMLKLGIPDKYAMERGGWSTTDTMKRVYQETFTDERTAADKKVDDYFSKIVATKLATDDNNVAKNAG